jgi:hypothetical protein
MMIDSNLITVILESLESTDERFKTSIGRIIRLGLDIANNSEEFKEELSTYDDFICHVYVKDLDFNIWINHTDGKLSFNNNIYENHSKEEKIIHFILKREVLKKMFRQKLPASEAYMKGLIEIDGFLADAMMIKNLWLYFSKFFRHLITN